MGTKESKLLREYKLEKFLGSGAFGVVIEVKNKFDEYPYAVKLIMNPNEKSLNEVKVFAKLSSHQNVVSYKSSWMDTLEKSAIQTFTKDVSILPKTANQIRLNLAASSIRLLCIQMELYSINLRTYLDNLTTVDGVSIITDRMHWHMFLQICKGLQHIHDHNIIHRELKPDNIFLSKDYHVKIGDLGIARALPQGVSTGTNLTAIGTRLYMAPEQVTGNYGKAVDIFALGIILGELFSHLAIGIPFLIINIMLRNGKVPEALSKKYKQIAELILNMVKEDPNERVSLREISWIWKDIKEYLLKDYHYGIRCHGCNMDPIIGMRYCCMECLDFDFCEDCNTIFEHDPDHTFEQLNEKETANRLRAFIIENIIKGTEQGKYKVNCFKCRKCIKTKTAYACQTCNNAFYCKVCFAGSKRHTKAHTFEVVTVNHDEKTEGTSSRDEIMGQLCLLLANQLLDPMEEP